MKRTARDLGFACLIVLICTVALWALFGEPNQENEPGMSGVVLHEPSMPERPAALLGSSSSEGGRAKGESGSSCLTVQGLVQDSNGEPVQGAVWRFPVAAGVDGGGAIQRGVSGVSGEFELSWDPAIVESSGFLMVSRPGFVPWAQAVHEIEPRIKAGRLLRVILTPGLRLSGIVVDPWGRGLAGARVEAFGRHGEELSVIGEQHQGVASAGDLLSSLTDSAGRYSISGIKAFPLRVHASKPGYVHHHRGVPPLATRNQLQDIVLCPLYRAGIRIVDARTKRTIENVFLGRLFPEGLYSQPTDNLILRRPGHADADQVGSAELTWIGARATGAVADATARAPYVDLDLRAWGYRDTRLRLPLSAVASASENDVREVVMQPLTPPEEWGALTITLSGAACRGVHFGQVPIRVAAAEEGGSPSHGRTLIAREWKPGEYRVTLPAGTYDVRLGAGTGWMWWRNRRPGATRVEVPREGSASIELEFRAARVRLRVLGDGDHELRRFRFGLLRRGGGTGYGVIDTRALTEDATYARYRTHLDLEPPGVEMLLWPGAYSVYVVRDGHELKPVPMEEAVLGATTDWVVRLAGAIGSTDANK